MTAKTASEIIAKRFGYMTLDEVRGLRFLASIVAQARPIFVNIGAGCGTSALAMYEGNPEASINTIDISAGGPLGGLENERNAFSEANYLPVPHQVLMSSHEAARLWHHGEINLLFIDNGHEQHEIEGDIALWLPKLARAGIVAFHDYGSPHWPAVKTAVDTAFSGRRHLLLIDSLIAFRVH